MDPFVDQLAELCRAQVTRCKWVFVPSHAIGRTLGERIALGGTNWLNLRFVTPLDVALRMGAPFLVERGIDPSEEGLGPALMMRLLLDLPEEGGYFRPIADQPSMAQALWRTVRELRMEGVASGDLRAAAFESVAKHREVQAILSSYETFLLDNHRGDMAAVYEEALNHPDWCAIQTDDCWTELPDTLWQGWQRRLIDAMPGERILPRAVSIPGAATPRRLQSANVARIEPGPADSPLTWLLEPNGQPPTSNGERRLALFHAGGREAEIDEMFRRVLASGTALDEVEIACGSDEHVALVWEKALRREWPVTLGPGIPSAATRPGRAVLGFCDWIETDFSANHFRRLLQSGDLGVEREDEGFTSGEAARTLARAQAGWGRATYVLALGRLEKTYARRAVDANTSDDDRAAAAIKAALTKAVAQWIDTLIAGVPEPAADGLVPLQGVVDAVLTFTEDTTSRVSQLDHRSGAALLDYVAELRALGAFRCSLSEALRFVRERVSSLQVAPDRPRPGHLYVSRLQHGATAGRRHLFVAGLEEGRLFPTAAEDPVLLDAERAAIAPALRQSSDRIDEAVWAVLTRLAAARTDGVVTFSYSCRDTREFRETYASWLMLQAYRLQQRNATATYQAMKAALGEPVSIVPADRIRATTDAGWWLRSIVGTAASGVDAVDAAFPNIVRGRHAEAQRGTSDLTEFDGHVNAAGTVLDPCAAGNAFSVTELESAAGCPFRFFLKRGLGRRPLDDNERDRDTWLDPLTRGSALHDVYAALLIRSRDAHRRPTLSDDRDWLLQYAQHVLDALAQEMPAASAELLDRETRDFLADVELFLDGEVDAPASEAVGLEVSFGRPLGDDEDPLARDEPVDVDLGGGLVFRIAGRIDRIDRAAAAEFDIIDYKTGGYWPADWQGVFNGGRRLQHALYGLAAAELLRLKFKKPRVARAIYYFSSHKGRRERKVIDAPSRAQIAGVLADLRETILQGTFVHASDQGTCRFCDFKTACGEGAGKRAAAKLSDPKLAAFSRLAAHA
jgi:ATP-dependent helicase/nuclease subunit B